MLINILKSIRNNSGTISLTDLSKEFNIEISLVEQMLNTLERSGKLIEIKIEGTENCTSCEECPILNNCSLTDIFQEKRYQLT
ncbi:MAG: winged helix-turn-helix transcriptional regulator [Chloroflexi bacterium]|jgi:Mn-dependent DtxR family transcriptional regulator|nr:winged helix-turn-helix transcriptional regulator [Chloroflexota bacterium]MBT3670752.1 winged helix-turn-helix transcriptional regulator [Chloroflexota bacterium]MBT4004125.1 winged helix-turn-helix transcriptional regulator [Chloroflexota bacterium]MBT4305120.1 winged helix-turn-helix transcriptional regulator [Chloroflexota bacterium]MBT4533358.1 winged helix-turn-helix transcriptional regulator [Chloroflexota bacterium]